MNGLDNTSESENLNGKNVIVRLIPNSSHWIHSFINLNYGALSENTSVLIKFFCYNTKSTNMQSLRSIFPTYEFILFKKYNRKTYSQLIVLRK